MKTAVDSSVLFDIVKGAPGADAAQRALEAALAHGSLCVCAVVVAELGRYFADAQELKEFLGDCQIDHDPLSMDAALEAARIMRGYRNGDNPARWKGHLDKLMAMPGKIKNVEHHAALPYVDIGAFWIDLQQQEGMGALALQFAILTAARSGEVRGASWSEIDLTEKVWVIPASRMKMKREHKVPLSDEAINLLNAVTRIAGTDLLFPNNKGTALSDMTLTAVIRRMGRTGQVTPHGFRSTFRDWASERTNYPRDVCEMALAHAIGDKVEAAYRRGDLIEKRTRLMRDWAKFINTAPVVGNNVIKFKAA